MPSVLEDLRTLAEALFFARDDFVTIDGKCIPNTTIVIAHEVHAHIARLESWEIDQLVAEVHAQCSHCAITVENAATLAAEFIIDGLRRSDIRRIEHERERLVASIP